MKICNTNRTAFYNVLNIVFKNLEIKPVIVEIGVLRGDNAASMYKIMSPKKMVLIDTWSAIVTNDAFTPFQEIPPWLSTSEAHNVYYGGPIKDQQTFEDLYQQCIAKFVGYENVIIIREDSINAIKKITHEGTEKFNVVYIDANHQYEWVLRDLMYWHDYVAIDGALVLNDCCFSLNGEKQNLGVLEAVSSFIKRTKFIPVLLTNTDWSDIVLVRKDSTISKMIDQIVLHSNIPWVEIPNSLLAASRIVYGKNRTNISFI